MARPERHKSWGGVTAAWPLPFVLGVGAAGHPAATREEFFKIVRTNVLNIGESGYKEDREEGEDRRTEWPRFRITREG